MATREEIELIRERVDMVEVSSRHIALKRRGKNYLAICPFHHDKRPSLVIDPERKLFHCFGCGAGGDVFKFLMKIEHLDFGEAVERLAQETGVELSKRGPSPQDNLRELNERVARYFQDNLGAEAGAAARAYLDNRGIGPDAMESFELGYALPGWDNLLKKFGGTDGEKRLLVQLGLVVQGREGRYFDRFRDRIIFPLCNPQGRVIGFSGRVFRGPGEEPKYLNISNTPLFKKGETVYGLHLARRGNPEELILVEGYTDVIALHRAGFKNTISTMGTALTEGQALLLRRFVERAVLAYDRDSAGQAAALRGMRALRNVGLDVQVALLPPGEDPDSLIRTGAPGAFRGALEAALPFHKFYISQLVERSRGGDPVLIERVLHEAGSFIQGIASRPLRHELIRGLAQEFGLPEEEIELELGRGSHRPRSGVRALTDERANALARQRVWGPEEHLLYFLFQGDLPVEWAVKELELSDFSRYRGIMEQVFAQAARGSLRPEGLLAGLNEDDQQAVTELVLSQIEFSDQRGEKRVNDVIIQLKLRRLHQDIQWVQGRLRRAETEGDSEKSKLLFKAGLELEQLRERLEAAKARGDQVETKSLLAEQRRCGQELLELKGR